MFYIIPVAALGVAAYGLWKYTQAKRAAENTSTIADSQEPTIVETLPISILPEPEPQPAPEPTSPKTFGELTLDQQFAFLKTQAKQEGINVRGSIANRLNNPGNLVWAQIQSKFGGAPGETIKGPDGKVRTFTKFPTLEAGYQAQHDLWTRKYSTLTFEEALKKWVDPHNVQEFANYVENTLKSIGIKRS
jgi:hypothetical protein